jgi:Uma2 family endonuclease
MSIAYSEPPSPETLADLLDRLGGIAPERIRMNPSPGTATVADVVRIERKEKRLFELVDGVLVEKVMGFTESQLAIVIAAALSNYLEADDLGVVTGPDGMIRFPANLVRMPDVAFVPWEEFPNGEVTTEAAPEVVPALAVEVLSPGNTTAEMSRKLREYFSAGVAIVWFVDPPARSVTVYVSPTRSKVVAIDGTLDGGKVLPGFQLPVAKIFARLKRTRKPKRNGR